MAAYLSKSEVALNSFIKGAPQSIANKVGDYLAAGCAVLNTLENNVAKSLIASNEVGINIEPENIEGLKNAILYFYENRKLTKEMGDNARALCEKRFDRKTSYLEIISLCESFL
jgi:glycosyltransferase involved in cell wall biosynthesis